jgi:hypothetical protein
MAIERLAYLEKDKSLGDSGTTTTDITIRDPITSLFVEVRATNGASYNHNNNVLDCVSKIEVIDGSKVLFSMSAKQAFAQACYDLGFWPQTKLSMLGGDVQSAAIPILFGRFIGDTERAFDPSQFVHPQLRVTWNLAAVRAVAATSFATGTATLTAIARVMEGAPAPSGFLLKKEHFTWTTAVGTEYIELPTDLPIKSLLLRSFLNDYHAFGMVSNWKLNCDGGKFVPFDVDAEDFCFLLYQQLPRLSYRESAHLKSGDTFYSYLKEYDDVHFISEDLNDIVYQYQNYEYGSQTVTVYAAGSASGSYVNTGAHVHGYFPFGYLPYQFGKLANLADNFPAPSYGSARLEAKGIVASGAGEVCLVQDQAY